MATMHETTIEFIRQTGIQFGIPADNFKRMIRYFKSKDWLKALVRLAQVIHGQVENRNRGRDPSLVRRLGVISREIRLLGFRDAECRRISRILFGVDCQSIQPHTLSFLPECPGEPVIWGPLGEQWWEEALDPYPPRVKRWLRYLHWNITMVMAKDDAERVLAACEADPSFRLDQSLSTALVDWKAGKQSDPWKVPSYFFWLHERPDTWEILERHALKEGEVASMIHVDPRVK